MMQQKICVEPKLFWMKRFTIVLLLLIYPADSRAQSTIGNWFTDNLVEGDTLYQFLRCFRGNGKLSSRFVGV
jgi:hypothetical protein